MIEAIERSQAKQMALVGSRVMGMLAIDESDALYQSFRSKNYDGVRNRLFGCWRVWSSQRCDWLQQNWQECHYKYQRSFVLKKVSQSRRKINKIWTTTKQRTSVKNAYLHWQSHGADFP